MSKRYAHLMQKQAKVKVIVQAYRRQKDTIMWFIALAAAALASSFYLFSFFFSFTFTGGRVSAGD